jgi:anti-sigma regulatory factor (Ser/Thr protein kinase)
VTPIVVAPIARGAEQSSRQLERMSTPSHPPPNQPPNVRLQLSPQPENVALIRTALAGVAEAIDLPPQALDDVRTAVTEAANNVVLHAYQGDHHGSLEVDTHIAPNAITVIVRDEGVGILPHLSGRDGSRDGGDGGRDGGGSSDGSRDGDSDGGILEPAEIDAAGSLKLGLPVITALASRVAFRARPAGGTEVRMEFATPPGSNVRTEFATHPGSDIRPELPGRLGGGGERSGAPELITAATIAITPDSLARTVLPRLLCALAARANFSTDRISDAQLLADAIAAQTFHSIIGEHLHVAVAVEPRQVQLHVGPLPLPAGHSDEALVDSVLGELAPVIERLADDHSLAPAGPASMLALQLLDRR